jgi:type I restriction enzyme M protein
MAIPDYSRMVHLSEISDPKNDFNLNIPRYINTREEEDIHNIEAHLLGGIPEKDVNGLSLYWNAFPSLQQTLFKTHGREGFYDLITESAMLKKTIGEHPDFKAYSLMVDEVISSWREKHVPYLRQIKPGVKPKETIRYLSEDLLKKFSDLALLDKYDVYQTLLNYWTIIMQDDVYQIAEEGWKAIISMDERKKSWSCDLLPKNLVTDKFFRAEYSHIVRLETEREALIQQITGLEDEQGGEDGLLADVRNDKEKVTKAGVQKRMKEIRGDADYADEQEVLEKHLELSEAEALLGRKIKESELLLDKKLLEKLRSLTPEEIKELVVNDKWMTAIEKEIKTEVERISQRLSQRLTELSQRYESTLSDISGKVAEYEEKVREHLAKMGFDF